MDGTSSDRDPILDRPVTERVYRVAFAFCGIGGGALGFKWARATLTRLGLSARFEIVGGIECDESTARDFERLTGAPCLVAKVEELTPERLREFFGAEVDVWFFSPPCKAASGLLAPELAATPKYQEMGMLGAVFIDLMFLAWPRGPRLILMENVPRIRTKFPQMLAHIRKTCRKHRFHVTEAAHDLGELGNLAQHRDRLLFVGRRDDVPSLLYQPIKRRVRAIGEVLSQLPLPGDPSAGRLHRLPAISPLTALRLALIPAGGDWKDLPAQVHLHLAFAAKLGARRGKRSERTPFNDVWRVVRWDDPAGCVTAGATPSAGGMSVADPRLSGSSEFTNNYAVQGWDAAGRTVAGSTQPGSGGPSVADPRLDYAGTPRDHDHGVMGWGDASGAVTGRHHPSNGRSCVADPRVGRAEKARNDDHGVLPWGDPSGTITGEGRPSNGRFSVADPRTVAASHPRTYGVIPWDGASGTITGNTAAGGGPFSVADPRVTCKTFENSGIYGVVPWDGSAGTVVAHACHDNGRNSVADPRPYRGEGERPRYGNNWRVEDWREPAHTVTGSTDVQEGAPSVTDPRRVVDPPFPLIIALDGTWHRPMTLLERAMLQGLPYLVDGEPLDLDGGNDACGIKIGDLVPPPAAEAIAVQVLYTLLHADAGSFALSSGGAVWVDGPSREAVLQ